MPHFVFSTATSALEFVQYSTPKDPRVLPEVLRTVRVKGGANLADKHLLTPNGVMTQVTDDEADFLVQNAAFLDAMKRGFIRIERHAANMDSVVNDMVPKDRSAPKTPEDYAKAPSIGAVAA